VMTAVALSVLAMFAVAVAGQRALGLSMGVLLLSMSAGGLAMLGVAMILRRRFNLVVTAAAAGPLLPTFPALGLAIFFTVAGAARAAIVISTLSSLLHIPDHPASEVFGVSSTWGAGGIALFVLAAVVIAPIAEECLFRGVLLPWLTTWMNPVAALWVSSFAFGVGHLYYGASVLIPTVYGVSLGWLRLRTGRLRAGIALHMLLNATATATLLLKAS
jgi:uncharacterized protein